MATKYITTVDDSGGNYTSLQNAETACQCNLTVATTKVFAHGGITGTLSDGDSVTGENSSATGTIVSITDSQVLIQSISGTFQAEKIYETGTPANYVTSSDAGDSAIVEIQCNSMLDTTAVSVNGWTLDATNKLILTSSSEGRNLSKVWDDTKYRLETTGNNSGITLYESNVEISWLQIRPSSSSADEYAINNLEHTNIDVHHCILDGQENSHLGGIRYTYSVTNPTGNIYRNIIYGFGFSYTGGMRIDGFGVVNVISNSVYGCWCGIRCSSTNHLVQDNIAMGSTTDEDFYAGTYSSSSDYNLDSDGSTDSNVGGSYNQASKAAANIFVDYSSDDFRIQRTGEAFENGTNSGATYNIGIGGNDVGSNWDIGADQILELYYDINTIDADYTTLSGFNAGEQEALATTKRRKFALCHAFEDTTPFDLNGWTTAEGYDINIEAKTGQTHPGYWSTDCYRLVASSPGNIYIYEDYVNIKGIQIECSTSSFDYRYCIRGGTADFHWNFEKLILKGSTSSTGQNHMGIYMGITPNSGSYVNYMNCIMYDFPVTNGRAIDSNSGANGTYNVYNCTVYNCDDAIVRDGGTFNVYDSAVFGNNDDFVGTFNTIMNCASNDGDGTNPVTPSNWNDVFEDVSTRDFRLKATDTDLQFAGAIDPSSGLYSDDAAGVSRGTSPTQWDIGALHAYTVLRTVKDSGGNYTGVVNAEADLQSDIGNLVANNRKLEIECYALASGDTGELNILSWTDGPANYIKIYTPLSERHAGYWDSSKYYITFACSAYSYTINIGSGGSYTRLEGLQVTLTGTTAYEAFGILAQSGSNGDMRISHCIVWNQASATGSYGNHGIVATYNVKIWNNIIYDWNDGPSAYGIDMTGWNSATSYCYNNTVHNCDVGIKRGSGNTVYAKNNIVQDCLTYCYDGTFDTANNNCSDDGTEPGTSGRNGEVSFVNEGADNFLLSDLDTIARGYGADLSSDTYLPFDDDILSEARPETWDIGASNAQQVVFFANNPEYLLEHLIELKVN